ncbi:DUF3991 and TOPRIM domain-containing protein [Tenacibaculum agarivorans]|uniref:DUF3991 and TOPRIM domain-containing protein n=1 Tax=Tenacibaculum agarivorans TaxID=1908389 RepID=UPI00094B9AA4|nr:DUF3991 and TOPRIM domain-containing protein [Tenacibaculum agarivorans]
MDDSLNLQNIKYTINLINYAASFGYKINKRKSTRNSVVMFNDGKDKIVVSRKNSIWMYFSVFDHEDNGTIINFIQNRTGKSIPEILDEFQSSGNTILNQKPQYCLQEKNYEPDRIKKLFSQYTAAKDHIYLNYRGIPNTVISSERFKGCIFKDKYGNAIFPHFKNGEVCGLEIKGGNISVFANGSEKTLWCSNRFEDDKTLAISEAPIDAMSYQILFSLKHVFYVATGGSISGKQMNLIHQILYEYSNLKRVLIITGNNGGGDLIARKIISEINSQNINIKRHSPKDIDTDWNDVLSNS